MEKFKPIWEATKEPLRVLVLSIIPFALAYFGAINTQWAVILTAALRYADKVLHELGKETGSENLTKGIVRF